MRRPRALALLLLAAAPHPALACEAPPSPQIFTIEHERFGEIGRHAITFRCAGGRLIAETEAEIEVELLGFTAFSRRATFHEVWDEDDLVRFDGRTIDNGEVKEVSARREGDRIVLDGEKGVHEVPADVVPDHPWNRAAVGRSPLFATSTGELRRVDTVPAGEEVVELGGRRVRADKFVLTGDVERELWFDEAGLLVWRLEERGAEITLTRRTQDR